MARRITCIVPSFDDSGGIDGLGGDGWTKSEATVIAEIEAGADYYVELDGRLVRVLVGQRAGHKYLRTAPNHAACKPAALPTGVPRN